MGEARTWAQFTRLAFLVHAQERGRGNFHSSLACSGKGYGAHGPHALHGAGVGLRGSGAIPRVGRETHVCCVENCLGTSSSAWPALAGGAAAARTHDSTAAYANVGGLRLSRRAAGPGHACVPVRVRLWPVCHCCCCVSLTFVTIACGVQQMLLGARVPTLHASQARLSVVCTPMLRVTTSARHAQSGTCAQGQCGSCERDILSNKPRCLS